MTTAEPLDEDHGLNPDDLVRIDGKLYNPDDLYACDSCGEYFTDRSELTDDFKLCAECDHEADLGAAHRISERTY